MAGLSVRPAVARDLASLRTIYLESRAQTFHWLDKSQLLPEDFDRDSEGELVLVAEKDSRILGFAGIWVPDHFIHHLYVHPDCARQGVGAALLHACYEAFPSPPALTLKCISENEAALAFYRSQGWRIIEEGSGPNGPYFLMEHRAL
ncbi:GNAT family N-acetyltransferase [Cohnella endophytica]|uniref:GNAT family N-acetyltransferase n=1 Tax=Cohnella endophytica TaxID=2419778 RepID=A0A494XHP4_9BACL|nr:GNAT family N-acetyltransferase [Cohnella endophytica]RKP50048.1 GNAT family N-acetyltransferase [Cohnella endophytica]